MITGKGVHISLGERAQDNTYSEKINGIIKNEYLSYRRNKNI